MSTPSIHDSRLAFAFPGVGVRLCGHEPAFFGRHQQVMTPSLQEASSFSGFDYVASMSDVEQLSNMSELQGQLFTYAFNSAVARVYDLHGAQPALMAGHSMGLYSALASAGVVTFSQGLEIVAEAYRLVSEASATIDAGMAVVVGLSHDEVDELLTTLGPDSSALKVNANNDTTMIFAGLRTELMRLVEEAKGRDALKARLLPVRAPYHHPSLLVGASENFERFLRGFSWSSASCPIVSSIDQSLLVEPSELLDLTARNITNPISWERVVQILISREIELIIECGAGISLHQNGRLMTGCPRFVTVKNAQPRAGL